MAPRVCIVEVHLTNSSETVHAHSKLCVPAHIDWSSDWSAMLVGSLRRAQAGDGWLPIDPADLKMTPEPAMADGIDF
jgi:hypothetical protein